MANENNKPNNASNTTTHKKKRSAAAQARRTAKWQAQKEAKKTAALAKQAAKKAEEEAKTQTVAKMLPNVMGIVGAQGFMPNIYRVQESSKGLKTALNTSNLFRGAHKSTVYGSDQTLLSHYLGTSKWDKAMKLLNEGVPKRILEYPMQTPENPMSPLQYTFEWNQLPLFKKLLEKGADPNVEYQNGAIRQPLLLYLISKYRSEEFVQALLDAGVNVTKRDSSDRSAMDLAIRRKNHRIIDMLLKKGVNIEEPNENGYTAVITAIAASDKSTLKKMVAKGIHINKQTGPKMLSPLKIAVISGNTEILDEVLQLKPDLTAKDNLGNTALHYAVMVNALQKIGLLVSAGANPRVTNKAGLTPINIAQEKKDQGDGRAFTLLTE